MKKIIILTLVLFGYILLELGMSWTIETYCTSMSLDAYLDKRYVIKNECESRFPLFTPLLNTINKQFP